MKSLIAYVFVAILGYVVFSRVPADGESFLRETPPERGFQITFEDTSEKSQLPLRDLSVKSLASPQSSITAQGKMSQQADCLEQEIRELKKVLHDRRKRHDRAKRKASRGTK